MSAEVFEKDHYTRLPCPQKEKEKKKKQGGRGFMSWNHTPLEADY